MGSIRGTHSSPGIYTKMTSIRKNTFEKTAPKSTAFINTGGGDGSSSLKVYFGYIPLKTSEGKLTDEAITYLLSLKGDTIKEMDHILMNRSSNATLVLNDGKYIDIKSLMSKEELEEKVRQGESFTEIADNYNNFAVLLVPKLRYENQNFDIIDNTFEKSLYTVFQKINDVQVNGAEYVFLGMFNENFSYSAVGDDKAIAPLKLIFRK